MTEITGEFCRSFKEDSTIGWVLYEVESVTLEIDSYQLYLNVYYIVIYRIN